MINGKRFYRRHMHIEVYETDYHVKEYTVDGTLISESFYYHPLDYRNDNRNQASSRRGVLNAASSSIISSYAYHRIDGPAYICYDRKTGKVSEEMWYFEGKEHREDGPAYICYSSLNGKITNYRWMFDDRQHREDGPACEEWWENDDGTLSRYSVEYYIQGKSVGTHVTIDYDDGTKYISYYDDPDDVKLRYESWKFYGEDNPKNFRIYISYGYSPESIHKDDGPAMIYYRKDGTIQKEEWFVNNELHRIDGPASITYNDDGSISECDYYIKGTNLENWMKENNITHPLSEDDFLLAILSHN